MARDQRGLPEPRITDEYNSEISAAKYMQIPRGFGKEVERTTQAVHDTIHFLYQKALDGKNGGEVDSQIRRLMEDEVPEAVEEAGEMIEQAREYEREIAEDRFFGESTAVEWGLSQDEIPEREQDFLEHYRRAEGNYRSIFEAFDSPMGGQNLVEFLEDEYGLKDDWLPEVPEPRPGLR
ncbi:MAG: hypothetical protein ABEK00_01775 [Candidatus Nanohaloarchaea archaeon]